MKNLNLSQIKAIENKISSKLVRRSNGCLEWSAGTHPQGYGLVGIGKRKYYVHRLVMCLALGRIITGKEHVLHKCDNPSCANPDHLFLGNQAVNIKDMDRKNRRNPAKGSKSGRAKLNEEKVLKMRSMYATGDYSFEELARHFGMSLMATHKATTGVTWRHVGGPINKIKQIANSKNHLKNHK